jgi:hypothetical protein
MLSRMIAAARGLAAERRVSSMPASADLSVPVSSSRAACALSSGVIISDFS